MGISILELVLGRLKKAGFAADVAYPGQKYPRITEPVASVHLEKVDRANLSVTVEVNIICPASLGGTACEVEALRATEELRWSGASCVQNGCTYDGIAQVYVVSILATYICITDEYRCTMGPGYEVYINEEKQAYVIKFVEEETHDRQVVYEIGDPLPTSVTSGSKCCWSLYLEELIPMGSEEAPVTDSPFLLQISSPYFMETYYGCYWTSIHREMTREGIRRIRKGYALERAEE